MCPAVGSIKRSRQRPTVDLPQPDSPTRPSVSPAKISNDTPSTARTTSTDPSTGKCFTRPRTLTSVSGKAGTVTGCVVVSTCSIYLLNPRLLCLVIRRNGRCQIVEYAPHLDTTIKL